VYIRVVKGVELRGGGPVEKRISCTVRGDGEVPGGVMDID